MLWLLTSGVAVSCACYAADQERRVVGFAHAWSVGRRSLLCRAHPFRHVLYCMRRPPSLTHILSTCMHCTVQNVYARMHTYTIHTRMHSCIYSCTHTYMRAYIYACIHKYIHACIHAYIYACMHAYIACVHKTLHGGSAHTEELCERVYVFLCCVSHSHTHMCVYACVRAWHVVLHNRVRTEILQVIDVELND